MKLLALALALAATPKLDARLVGTWLAPDGETTFWVMRADGTMSSGSEQLKWSSDGKTLRTESPTYGTELTTYRLSGDTFIVDPGPRQIVLTRAKDAARPDAGAPKR